MYRHLCRKLRTTRNEMSGGMIVVKLIYPDRTDKWEASFFHLPGHSSAHLHLPPHRWAGTPVAGSQWPLYCIWKGRTISRPPALQRSHLMNFLETK